MAPLFLARPFLLGNSVVLLPSVWSDARVPLLVGFTGIEASLVLDTQIIVDEFHNRIKITLAIVEVLVRQVQLRLAVSVQLVQFGGDVMRDEIPGPDRDERGNSHDASGQPDRRGRPPWRLATDFLGELLLTHTPT